MAINTPKHLNNMTIYQVYVRNHGPNGTFKDVQNDLGRIQSMNVDVVYLMPIHPIGQQNKKGALGCPYSIKDYRAINAEYGTEQDFRELVDAIHVRGMKVMIDVVFNHTAYDARYIEEHPDWYHRDENGKPYTSTPAWDDVIDLKHPNQELWNYLVGSLTKWVGFGVDGFRCDVASLLPIEFWERARKACAMVNRNTMWLAESVHLNFVRQRRNKGLSTESDSALYNAFDMGYDYDIWTVWQAAVVGEMPVERYIEMLHLQDSIYPENFIKMRCVENHDQPRIQKLAGTPEKALAWTAFSAFNKGPFFIYAGQESAAMHTPSLFGIDKIDWKNYELQETIAKLAALKKDSALVNGKLCFTAAEPTLQAVWMNGDESLVGIFNVNSASGKTKVFVADDEYEDLLTGESIAVSNGECKLPESAFIFRCALSESPKELQTPLMNFWAE